MIDQNRAVGEAGCRGWHRLQFKRVGSCVAGLTAWLLAVFASVAASPVFAATNSSDTLQGTSNTAVRRSAVQSIPFDQLDADSREKVNAVLSNVSIYRRLPIRAVNCDPDLYLFLLRHPDVVVNIWEILGVSQIQLRQIDIDTFRIVETEGTMATLEYVYHSHDLQIVYGKWTYTGPLLARKITGTCLAVLKTGYTKNSDGKYLITSRLDGFLSVDSGGAEMLARALQPLVVKNIDNNFIQTIAFLGSMSKTSEVNLAGMQRLAGRLTHVQSETRQQLSAVAASVAQRAAAKTAAGKDESSQRVASRLPPETPQQ